MLLLCEASSIFHRRVWYRALSLCYVCAMRVFDIRASSSTPRLSLVPNFVSVVTSFAKLACGEQLHTQSLRHPSSLFDVPRTEAFGSEQVVRYIIPN